MMSLSLVYVRGPNDISASYTFFLSVSFMKTIFKCQEEKIKLFVT